MAVRTRRAVAIAAAVSTVLLAYYAIAWAQVTPLRERGTDFSASYVAALLVRSGDGGDLYDQSAEHARHLTLLPAGTIINLPFITPPTTALLALPFTALDPGRNGVRGVPHRRPPFRDDSVPGRPLELRSQDPERPGKPPGADYGNNGTLGRSGHKKNSCNTGRDPTCQSR